MKIITHTDTIPQPTVATIGFFDGVHLGHRHLIDDVRTIAAERKLATAVVTFDAHPRQVLQQDFIPQLLSTTDEKLEMLAATGVDYCVLLHFDRSLAALSAYEFMRQVLREQVHARVLVTGYDVTYGRQLDIDVMAGTPFEHEGMRVSSSLIRRCLSEGDVDSARQALGYTYSLRAPIVSGYAEGRRMGFRTANLDMTHISKMLPARGVYATRVRIDDAGAWLPAMTNVGCRPTFSRTDTTIETYIFDFDASLYGHSLEVAFCHRLRDERRFADEAALAAQLADDERQARQLLTHTI